MSTIRFETKLFKINSWTILRLPESASAELPSRGMTMVSGTINGAPFKALLEPDGRYAPGQKSSHWFRPDKKLLDDASAKAGDTVQVSLEPSNEWIEPDVPEDLKKRWQLPQKPKLCGRILLPLPVGIGFAGYALSKHWRPAKSISKLRSTNSTKE